MKEEKETEETAFVNGFIQTVHAESTYVPSTGDDLKIPRLFFSLYFGGGALLYTLVTLWVIIACCFNDQLYFGESGVFYMFWIALLMWLSTALTIAIGKFVQDLRSKLEERNPCCVGVSILLKLTTDGLIFYGLVEALRDPHLVHYNDFHQFAGPLIYFGLLYLVTIIEVVVFILTVLLVEDPCKMFVYIEIILDFKKEFMANKCSVAEDV